MFDGDWHLALASYNGGPGRVQRAMKRYGRDDFWSLSANPRCLPRETREYVPMILAAIIIAQKSRAVRLHVPEPDAAAAAEKVTRRRAGRLAPGGRVDRRRRSTSSSSSIPNCAAGRRRCAAQAYELKVPSGSAETLRARLAEADAAERGALNWHTVRPGESIATIARKLRVNRADLAEANYLSVRSRVRPGQKLDHPARAGRADGGPARSSDAGGRGPSGRGTRVDGRRRRRAPSRSSRSRQVYRVKRGDTLSSIARLFETSVSAIKQWNRLRSNRINPGQRLTVYTAADR